MNSKPPGPSLLKSNLFLNNINEKNSFINNSNITGVFLPQFIHTTKNRNLNRSNSLSHNPTNSKKTDINFYNTLKEEEKLKYINDLISNALKKDSFDYMALKRKKFTISELIKRFNASNKPIIFEENKICKIPYPLLYCLSNRKCENNSSKLLTKIMTNENKSLTKKQELTIKYSHYSKIFNTDISKLISDKFSNKNNLSHIQKEKGDNLPILNKYLKQRFSKFYNKDNNNSSKYLNSTSNTRKWTKINNIRKNMRRWNSTSIGKKEQKKKKIKNDEFRNIVESFKNRNVNLLTHNNNMKNAKLLQDRINNIMEEKFYKNNRIKLDKSINKIIKDISHLRFNNQIMAFNSKLFDI
jgi:hypothetical protein